MKKLFFPILILIFVLLLAVKQKVGDIRPSVLPPITTQQTTQQKVGESVGYLSAPQGFSIGIFAKGIDNARDLEFSESGTLIVSQPSKSQVTALPDKNNDGIVDETKTVLSGLNNPHGIAFFNGKLFVAEETRLVRYNWNEKELSASLDKVLFNLPKGGRHFTRSISFNKEGKMFVTIGSSCDVCNEKSEWFAAVIVSNSEGESPRLFAKGLRNSVFITINPKTNELWGTEMGRDFLGDQAPPDEINTIKENNPSAGSGPRDYGWPNCYGNKIYDLAFNSDLKKGTPCKDTESPIYEIPAHSAPLGLAFIQSEQFPSDWQGDLLIAYHGSWNSSVPVGYKVVRLSVDGNTVSGEENFITGFLQGSLAIARPVDVIFDKKGSLFVSDDKGGNIYKVIKK